MYLKDTLISFTCVLKKEKSEKKNVTQIILSVCRNKLIVHSCSLQKERGSQTNLKESQTFNEKTQSLNLL